MKNIAKITHFIILIITVFSIASGWAMTQEDLKGAIQKEGIEKAVVAALAEGMSPQEIVKTALTIEGLNPRAVIVALFKAGIDHATIARAAKSNNIGQMVLASARAQFLSKKGEGAQPYTPAAPVTPAPPVPGPAGGGFVPAEPYASPSTL